MKALVRTGIILLLLLGLSSTSSEANQKMHSLCELHYPSDYLLEWKCVEVTSDGSPSRIFGKYWKDGLRFNRMVRRHFIAGLWIKVPRHLRDLRGFNPMPEFYPDAEQEPQFILVDQNEMFLGAYEYGRLVFSSPVAVGIEGYRLRNGSYQVDAVDAHHESSLYRMEGSDRYYPMHYGLRFYTDKRPDGWSTYWFHGRDVPGYPASHGCIGLYDEEMQKEYYKEPARPVLMDAKRLYQWVVGGNPDDGKFENVHNGPKVLIMGDPPTVAEHSPGLVIVPASGKPGQRP